MFGSKKGSKQEQLNATLLALRWAAAYGYQMRLEPRDAKQLVEYIGKLQEREARRSLAR